MSKDIVQTPPPPSYFDQRMPDHGMSREEQGMLKSALAYVIVRARQKHRSQVASRSTSPLAKPYHPNDKGCKRSRDESSASDPISESTSPLDRLVSIDDHALTNGIVEPLTTVRHRKLRKSDSACLGALASSLLRRKSTDSTVHLDKMFKVACSIAKTTLIRRKLQRGNERTSNDDDSAALVGATTHLAIQLKTLLLMEQEEEEEDARKKNDNDASFLDRSNTDSAMSAASKRTSKSVEVFDAASSFPEAHTPPRVSQTSSSPAPSSTKRHERGQVTPAIQNQQKATHLSNKTVRIGSWIYESMRGGTDIVDIRAAFFVYRTMIPYIGMNHPALIGHIFLVTVKMVRNLYDDEFSFPSHSTGINPKTSTGNGRQVDGCRSTALTINALAIESLRLLESCWFATIPHDVEREHREFLLLTLQDVLGDLLVPLPLSEFSSGFNICSQNTSNLIRHKRHQDRLLRQHQYTFSERNNDNDRTPRSNANRSTGPFSKSSTSQRSSTKTSGGYSPLNSLNSNTSNNNNNYKTQFLDPGAKMIMRLGVYRLITV